MNIERGERMISFFCK